MLFYANNATSLIKVIYGGVVAGTSAGTIDFLSLHCVTASFFVSLSTIVFVGGGVVSLSCFASSLSWVSESV